MYKVTIDSNDHEYVNILYYINKLTNHKKTKLIEHDYLIDDNVKLSFKYNKKKINVKTYKDNPIVGTQREPKYLHFIELSSSDIQTIKDFIIEAEEVYDKDHYFEPNSISIWVPFGSSPNLFWNFYTNLKMRNINSVILDKGLKEDIVDDIKIFLKNDSKYEKYGIPYKRVYCLYGPPGTGKSSIVFSIASTFKKNIAMLNFGSGVTDASFIKLMSTLKPNSILLLEDIDALFTQRKASSTTGTGFLSFSTLLNVLDGNLRKNGLITFMTTNHPDKLDPALMRTGRIDYTIKIDYITKYQIEKFAKLYYPKINKKQLDEYTKILSKFKKLTPSEVSNYMFLHIGIKMEELLKDLRKRKSLKQ